MNKMVKYCAVCEESFAEKFSFCPNCASVLATFEMKPIEPETIEAFAESVAIENKAKIDNNGFYQVTFVEPKNNKTRNLLLLGAFVLMMTIATGGVISSLFNSDAYVGALDDDLNRFVNVEENPSIIEVEVPEIKAKGKGGGGGGGGRQDEDPISKGELPPQFKEKPLLTPSKEDISVTDPTLKVTRGTRGPNDIIPKKRSSTNGDPNSSNPNASNGLSADNLGMGQNGLGGIGTNGRDGVGRNGIGGIGTVTGNNYGDNPNGIGGTRDDETRRRETPPDIKIPTVPSIALNITSKPRALYTDAARQFAVQGTVTLRVTFLANGQIGSVVAVSSLPHGLTEQAIASARNIRFEPAKKNGVAITVTKNVQYNFTLY